MSEHVDDENPGGDTPRDTGGALVWGWTGLLVSLSFGVVLEALHGFKVQWFLHPDHETRHLLLRLAHAHGTGLSLVLLGFGATLHAVGPERGTSFRSAETLYRLSLVLIPGGFLLGGLFPYGGDPGLGIVFVPIGALCLFTGVLRTVLALRRR